VPHRTGVLAIVAITAVVGLSTPALAEGSPPPAARVSTAVGAAPNPNQGDYHKLLRATIADLQAYWAQEFPQVYGGMYTPVGQFVAATPTTKIPNCQGRQETYQKDVKGNAFYCFGSNFITYDDQNLFPYLAKHFGNFAPALVLAHEWGHAIQDRAGIDRNNEPTILVELQADCFAGSWVQRIATGASKAVKFAPGDLDAALAAYLTFRDAVGSSANDQQAHGDAFDRVNAFQTGFDGGATACKPFFDNPPPITEQEFTTQQEAASGGNLPEAQVLPATMDLLNDFYSKIAPDVPPLTLKQVVGFNGNGPTSRYPTCGGGRLSASQVKNRIFYCLADNYIGVDTTLGHDIYSTIGDFGVAVLVGDAYATYIQYEQHFPGVSANTANAVFDADCSTGAWAGAIAASASQGGLPAPSLNTSLSLASGDLDKVIQAFISYNSVREVNPSADFVFRRVEAFRRGFFDGHNSCAAAYGQAATNTPSG
jgi:predicted metalloprotease